MDMGITRIHRQNTLQSVPPRDSSHDGLRKDQLNLVRDHVRTLLGNDSLRCALGDSYLHKVHAGSLYGLVDVYPVDGVLHNHELHSRDQLHGRDQDDDQDKGNLRYGQKFHEWYDLSTSRVHEVHLDPTSCLARCAYLGSLGAQTH